MAVTDRVKQILSWYSSENPGTLTNLARLLNHGTLAGTGKLVILPVDQGFEHGPARSFAPNPAGYDPDYHFQLAIDAGCNAYAAPLGSLEASASKFAGQVPMILKLNNSDSLAKMDQPISALTGSVEDALRLGCVGIGYTIYPGSGHRNQMYQDFKELTAEAKAKGHEVLVGRMPFAASGRAMAVRETDGFGDKHQPGKKQRALGLQTFCHPAAHPLGVDDQHHPRQRFGRLTGHASEKPLDQLGGEVDAGRQGEEVRLSHLAQSGGALPPPQSPRGGPRRTSRPGERSRRRCLRRSFPSRVG